MNRWHTGLILLGVVVFLWVASGFMVNAMSGQYEKPYFITYLNTGVFTVYLIPSLLKWRKRSHYAPVGDVDDGEEGGRGTGKHVNFTVRETATIGMQFAFLWFMANLFNNASYLYTTVSSATVIACTSSFFTLIIGSMCGIESFSMKKLFALIVSFAGVCFLSLADGNDEEAPPNALLGNFYALVSAALYGVYTTLLKYKVEDESRIDTKLFFGFVGLSNTIIVWPVLVLFHFVGIERFELPPNSSIWWLVILNSLSTIVSDFLWIVAMLMTSPLVVTVGLSATIPLSMFGDLFWRHHFGSVVYYIGAAMVCWSFFVVNNQEQHDPAVVTSEAAAAAREEE